MFLRCLEHERMMFGMFSTCFKPQITCRNHIFAIFVEIFRKKNFFSNHFGHQNSIFWTSKNFQILLDWVDQAEKKWIPDLYEPVKTFLSFQHLWWTYLKHSSGSGLSNARTLMSVRHTKTKRHRVFWFTVINWGLRHLLDFTCLQLFFK